MGRHYEDDDEPYVIIEKKESSLGSFVVGLAIGAGIALLFAPKSGAETRDDIARRARAAKEKVRDVADEATEAVSESFHDAKGRVERRIEEARQAVELKKQQVTRAMEAGRAAARQAREDLERRISETKAAYRAGGDVARDARAASAMPPDDGDDSVGI